MNAANWTSVAFKFFECSDHRVDVTLTTNFLYKSVYCSIFILFSLGFLSRTGLVELEPALRPLAIAEEFTALNSKETHDVDLPVYFPP